MNVCSVVNGDCYIGEAVRWAGIETYKKKPLDF